jgi:hypothetical protein
MVASAGGRWMRKILFLLTLTFLTPVLCAQDPTLRVIADNVYIAPIRNVPFSATVITESTPANGTHTSSRRIVARDGSGRIVREIRRDTLDGQTSEASLMALEYSDPAQHKLHYCFVQARTCYVYPYLVSIATYQAMPFPRGLGHPSTYIVEDPNPRTTKGPYQHGPTTKTKELGQEQIDGMSTSHVQETSHPFDGSRGGGATSELIREFWYSADLQVNLTTKFTNHRFTQTQTLTDLSRTELDSKFFNPPTDYQLVPMQLPIGVSLAPGATIDPPHPNH